MPKSRERKISEVVAAGAVAGAALIGSYALGNKNGSSESTADPVAPNEVILHGPTTQEKDPLDYTSRSEIDITTGLALEHYIPVAFNTRAVITTGEGDTYTIDNPIVDIQYNVLPTGGPDYDNPVYTFSMRTDGSDGGEASAVRTYVPGERGVTVVLLDSEGNPTEIDNTKLIEVPLRRQDGTSGDTAEQTNFVIDGDRFDIDAQGAVPQDWREHGITTDMLVGAGEFVPRQS
jgi:hypothetical protein